MTRRPEGVGPSIYARAIQTSTHGRYLVRPAVQGTGRALLVGFHGYRENADIQMKRLAAIEAAASWTLISIQGLNRFYHGRSEEVIAGWMTRQDRELAIADNLAYVARAASDVADAHGATGPKVFAGFSQGVAMAFRAACSAAEPGAVAAVGGDIPPELSRNDLGRLSTVLLIRGVRDEWYTPVKWNADRARLQESGVANQSCEMDAGHEWTMESGLLIGRLLKSLE